MLLSDYWADGLILDSNVSNERLFEYSLKRRGWVYLAQNKKSPHLKIGRTSKSPFERMTTLQTSGVEGVFTLLKAVSFVDSYWAEAAAHRLLHAQRVEGEFFNVSCDEAYSCLLKVQSQEMTLFGARTRSHYIQAPTLSMFQSLSSS